MDSNKTMSFKVSDKKLLKKYTKICGGVGSAIGKNFDIESSYGDKYIKTKIKSYGDKIDANFQGEKVPKGNTLQKCLSVIMLDSFVRAEKSIIHKNFWKGINMK